ncbi:3-isopropylmalate dehydrogenase [Fimicolochytrium jonesii]|uniref:3-isopropylmalate dehydrogenase n=1 Tax=Fimicolochytrium jonesii TaxID=1396493 RepID=UPI0022FEB1D8|nr:3-isopropylmalate dehydrogenase [Fimicolochytrium jonesii]KAI8819340.1 3-isopropylmalate dehydrogenase [Fimicolochytrium jonesii]
MTTSTVSSPSIVLLSGDGIGPEIVAEARRILTLVSTTLNYNFTFHDQHLIGGAAIDATGSPLPDSTLNACRSASAILLGAVGGPQWPKPATKENPSPARPEQGLLKLRKELGLYANIRPCSFPAKSLLSLSPLKESIVEGCNIIFVRELTGGIYFGKRQEENEEGVAWDTMEYSVGEIQRITRIAASISSLHSPPLPITSIDKANVLATSRLWRKTVTQTLKNEFPAIPLQHNLVDSAAMLLVKSPMSLNGVILTENMFGDILSDEASVIPGSLGLLPSASLSGWGAKNVGLYEPIHGSAPDIAGKGIANPIGTILSAAMLLEYSFGLVREAKAIEEAVAIVLDEQALRTKDLGGEVTTKQMGDAVLKVLEGLLQKLK